MTHRKEDLAGCFRMSRSRFAGSMTAIYNPEAQGIDVDGSKYAVTCETHGAICGAETLADAKTLAAYPDNFCEECQGE